MAERRRNPPNAKRRNRRTAGWRENPPNPKRRNEWKSPEILKNHVVLNLTICSPFTLWRIFASSINRHFSWSSSLSSFFITTFSPCPFLTAKANPKNARPIGPSFPRKFPHWKRGKPWQTKVICFWLPFREGNSNVILNAHWVGDLRFVGDLLRQKFNLNVAVCSHQLSNQSYTGHVRDVTFRWLPDGVTHDGLTWKLSILSHC